MAVVQISLASGTAASRVEHREVDLGLVAAVELDLLRVEADLLCDLGHVTQLCRLGDLEAGGEGLGHQWDTAAAASSETSVSV
jgi:hypothetical protein